MTYPIAEKFKLGTYEKPSLKREEFYKGGYHAMKKRLQEALHPFPGAYAEYLSRSESEDMEYSDAVGIMWEYVELV
ncbi:MAG: hypothetical protein FWD90_05620 [Defluviitaleaceae bacterium]|nr:hypothetical protein [Defluviitaleaceae bacterium]